MRIAVYGGSFHPPHVGHAMVAAWLLWTRQVDQVWLVPAFDHPFAKDLPSHAERMRWCAALASAVGEGVLACGIEAELERPSYTILTLEALRARHPEHGFRLVLGADAYAQTGSWRRWADIEREFSPIVVGRAGYAEVADSVSFPNISSTEVRERLRAGMPVDHLVPAAVLAAMRG
jgi:nicotinate-nucleotide adenylyltransferase